MSQRTIETKEIIEINEKNINAEHVMMNGMIAQRMIISYEAAKIHIVEGIAPS